ncbi:MAG: hypothetical protein WCG97_00530 [bacterium]
MSNILSVIPENLTLGIVIVVMTLLAFFKGRKILYSLMLSFFPAVMMYQAFTHWGIFVDAFPKGFFEGSSTNRVGFFLVVYIFMFYIIQRLIGYEISRRGLHKILDSVFLSLGLVAESLVLIFQTLGLPDFYHLSSSVEVFVASAAGTVIMLIVAVFALMYSSRA